ncbi:MAG: AlpA family phage regulatory protein, partial [Synechococcus sp. TMED20]
AAGEFPKQITIDMNSVVWLESDVTKWMDQRIGAQ